MLARWTWKKYIFKRKLVQVTGKTFEIERVPLDGREYSYCKFNNVTFLHGATAPVHFHHNHISGGISIESDNLDVLRAISMLRGFGLLRSGLVFDVGPNGTPRVATSSGAPPPTNESSKPSAVHRLKGVRRFASYGNLNLGYDTDIDAENSTDITSHDNLNVRRSNDGSRRDDEK